MKKAILLTIIGVFSFSSHAVITKNCPTKVKVKIEGYQLVESQKQQKEIENMIYVNDEGYKRTENPQAAFTYENLESIPNVEATLKLVATANSQCTYRMEIPPFNQNWFHISATLKGTHKKPVFQIYHHDRRVNGKDVTFTSAYFNVLSYTKENGIELDIDQSVSVYTGIRQCHYECISDFLKIGHVIGYGNYR